MTAAELIKNAPFELSEEDKQILSGNFPDYQPHAWDELRQIIAAGEMSRLKRSPVDMRNYLVWYSQVSFEYGSIAEYVRQKKLKWDLPVLAEGDVLFGNTSDYKIIRNDWPYGMVPGIAHLVVWSKLPIEVLPETGMPSDAARRAIERFLDQVVGQQLGCQNSDGILWFKQKSQWQSVRALEHIHLIIRGVAEERLEELTGQKATMIISRVFST